MGYRWPAGGSVVSRRVQIWPVEKRSNTSCLMCHSYGYKKQASTCTAFPDDGCFGRGPQGKPVQQNISAEKGLGDLVEPDKPWVGIGALLEGIVAQAYGKKMSQSLKLKLHQHDNPIEARPSMPLIRWFKYVQAVAPRQVHALPEQDHSRYVERILQNLNEKRPILEGAPMKQKLSAQDVVYILDRVIEKSSAFAFYQWARLQPGYVADKSIYAAILECLLACSPSTENWLHLEEVMKHMLWRKICQDDSMFVRLTEWGRERGAKQPYSETKVRCYVRWFLEMKNVGFEPSSSTYEKLMRTCNRAELYESTLTIFREMPSNNYLWAYALALSACRGMNNLEVAELYWKEMKELYVKPDVKCYTNMLGLYGDHQRADKAQGLYMEMLQEGVTPDMFVYNSLLHAYARVGRVKQAENIFDIARRSGARVDPAMYRALSACYRQAGYFKELLALFDNAKLNKIPMGATCYSAAIKACADNRLWETAAYLLKQMQACGFCPSPKLFSTIVYDYTLSEDFFAGNHLCFKSGGILST